MAYGTIHADKLTTSTQTIEFDALTAPKIITETPQLVSASYSITPGNNAISVGPVTIPSNLVVNIPVGSTWVIL